MYKRLILSELEKWKLSTHRKPLILRGARQVGKTTAIHLFAQHYPQYIYLNLERPEEAKLFRQFQNVHQLIEAIFFLHQKNLQQKHQTLLFIDEIQQVPEALSMLRYFYEEIRELHVIAAGSLLETVLKENISIPVGRVEYRVLKPVTFYEFLVALNELEAAKMLHQIPLKEFAHDKLLQLFHTYTLIGGMPEVVQHYVTYRDLTSLSVIYESILVSYLDDVEKYARNNFLTQVVRHCIRTAFAEAGKPISFNGFGQSNYKSREVGEAIRILEKVMLLKLVYPTSVYSQPLLPDKRKKPKLQILDTGLMNRFAGLQAGIIGTKNLNEIYSGRIAEHIVAQELLAANFNVLNELCFWVREKKDASAEVDYLFAFEDKLIPIEVKSGAVGKLRSLHQFMDSAPHAIAVRLYNGQVNIHKATSPNGKPYHLINLPYYLTSQLQSYLDWFKKNETYD